MIHEISSNQNKCKQSRKLSDILFFRQLEFLHNRHLLLNDMVDNIDDEKTYIRFFIQLTEMERMHFGNMEFISVDPPSEEIVDHALSKLLIKGPCQSRISSRKEILEILSGTNPSVIIGSSDVETIDIHFSGAPVEGTVEVGEAPTMSI